MEHYIIVLSHTQHENVHVDDVWLEQKRIMNQSKTGPITQIAPDNEPFLPVGAREAYHVVT